nr:hypothetical protein [Tanacetum cinerariifolium]
MDDPNITMEEYMRLEEEKAQRHGRTSNWQTTTYGKMEYCKDEDDSFMNFETEYPTIVFDDTLTSDAALSCEPTISPLNENKIGFRISFDESDDEDYMVIFDENLFYYKIISVDNLKKDSKNGNDKVNMPSSPEPTISHYDNLDFFNDFENEFPAITYKDDLTSKLIEPLFYMCRLASRSTPNGIIRMVFTQEYCKGQECLKILNLLTDPALFSNMAPLPLRDQRHQWLRSMDQETANVLYLLEQYLFRHAEGRNSGARLSEGYFIGRLAAYFGLVGDQGFRGLLVVTRELPLIDLHELGWLNICERIGDTWAWVASGPERQADATTGAHGAAEDAPAVDEGAQADPVHVQAPQPLPPTPRTMP